MDTNTARYNGRPYAQLTIRERLAVDVAFSAAASVMRREKVPFAGDDRAERVVDAISRAVIESRPLAVSPAPTAADFEAADQKFKSQ